MRASELRQMDDAALKQQLQDAKQELFNLRFQLATGKSVNTARIRLLKKDIARILTILRERRGR
ncbi:ribosomal protein L29 [Thermobaculum terrenum ATCC BAA-798]|uniref:Large ribosomal subunit protein uL29 n=1 Tax=Thermobaculum terrenum (strain ATCC BAA-798 / CCMEE 7001 / YNP1) TaxID=525904 RepID=D1CFD4_THET1|nr:50S ribosomal protein L29 [Thermobaculum terrenum]ACZ41640.1 ribosomal protein L29 [Thermobaculum terrenum ATCC BAA-798]